MRLGPQRALLPARCGRAPPSAGAWLSALAGDRALVCSVHGPFPPRAPRCFGGRYCPGCSKRGPLCCLRLAPVFLASARPHLHRRRWHGALGCRHGHQDQETQLEAVAASFVPAAAALMTVSAREPCPEHANHHRMPLQRATTEMVPAVDDDASLFSWSLVVASRESCWLTACGVFLLVF